MPSPLALPTGCRPALHLLVRTQPHMLARLLPRANFEEQRAAAMRHPLLRHGHHLARRRTALPRAAVRDFRALARALPCRDGVGAASCAAAGAPECEPASLPPLSGSPTCFSFFLVGPARSKSAQTNPASYSAHCAPLRPLGPAPARGQRWCAPPSPRQGAPPGTPFSPSRVLSVPSPALRRRARPARALWPSRAVLRS